MRGRFSDSFFLGLYSVDKVSSAFIFLYFSPLLFQTHQRCRQTCRHHFLCKRDSQHQVLRETLSYSHKNTANCIYFGFFLQNSEPKVAHDYITWSGKVVLEGQWGGVLEWGKGLEVDGGQINELYARFKERLISLS